MDKVSNMQDFNKVIENEKNYSPIPQVPTIHANGHNNEKLALKIFTASLKNLTYGLNMFSKEVIENAKRLGIVIVYGASDDLMEFDGAIYDEASCFDGGEVYITKDGVVDENTLNAKCIEAIWCGDKTAEGDIITWSYKTDIPHETFVICDEGEVYCKGIVFYKKDI